LFVGSFVYRAVVVRTMVTFFFRLMFFSRFRRRVEFSLSRLDVGSSARIACILRNLQLRSSSAEIYCFGQLLLNSALPRLTR